MADFAFAYAAGLIVNMNRLLAMTCGRANDGTPIRTLHFEGGTQVAVSEEQGKALEDALRNR